MIRYLLLFLSLFQFITPLGIVIPPLRHQTRFTSSSSLSNYLEQYQNDEIQYEKIVQEYFEDIPCLRQDLKNDELFVIIKLKFLNIEENFYTDKGFKNQILNLNIIHNNRLHHKNINIIRNKKDITEGSMRFGFKVPSSSSNINELNICFENILIDRSKLLKSLKKDETNSLISRDIDIEIMKFADFDQFQKLNNQYDDEIVLNFEKKILDLDKIDEIINNITLDIKTLEQDEKSKRDLNEKVFQNTLIFQIILVLLIVLFNFLYLYRILKHLYKKKLIS